MFWQSSSSKKDSIDISAPSPLTAFGGVIKRHQQVHSTPSTPSTTTASPATTKLAVVNASTFFQQHPLTPPPLPPNLDYDFDQPHTSKTARHISRRRGTEQPKGVTERYSDDKRRASDFRGPAPPPLISRRSPRTTITNSPSTTTKEPPLLTHSTTPIVKQLQPASEVYMLPTTRTTSNRHPQSTTSTPPSATTGSPRSSMTTKPHPDYQDKIMRLTSSPEKYRDEVVAELFSQVKNVPVGGLTTRRRSFEPNRDTAMTAATIAALLGTASTELDRPLKDVSGALRNSDAALERSVDIANLATGRNSDSAPNLIITVAQVHLNHVHSAPSTSAFLQPSTCTSSRKHLRSSYLPV